MTEHFSSKPHRRLNIHSGEWIQVSPHRTKRPWQGQQEEKEKDQKPEYDEYCYLCTGNSKAGGAGNPDYKSTFAFDNDFSALVPDIDPDGVDRDGLLVAHTEKGICRVICFSPRHDLTLPEMETGQIRNVIDLWLDEYRELGSKPYVQIFENKGEIRGAAILIPTGRFGRRKRSRKSRLKSWFSNNPTIKNMAPRC